MSRQHLKINRQEWERARRLTLDRLDWRCQNPDCPAPHGPLEVHHVMALERGGHPTDSANLTVLCRGCHIQIHLPDRTSPARLEWLNLIKGMVTQ